MNKTAMNADISTSLTRLALTGLVLGVLVFVSTPASANFCNNATTTSCAVDLDCPGGSCVLVANENFCEAAPATSCTFDTDCTTGRCVLVLDHVDASTDCMQEVFSQFGQGGNLNCTANDVALTPNDVTIIDGCTGIGDTATIGLVSEVDLNAQKRYDIGIYLALEGDALTGTCDIFTLPYAPAGDSASDFTDLDGTDDDTKSTDKVGYCGDGAGNLVIGADGFPKPCDESITSPPVPSIDCDTNAGETCQEFGITGTDEFQDTCGDIDNAPDPIVFDFGEITIQCIDTNADGSLDLPSCTSWDQNAGFLCLSPLAALPGAPSKCNCESVELSIDIPSTIEAVKALDGPGLFDLAINGTDPDGSPLSVSVTDVGNGGTTDPQDVESGTTHTVSEAAGTGTDLVDYDKSIECVDNVGRCSGDTSLHCTTDDACVFGQQDKGPCDLTPTVVASCTDCATLNVTTSADFREEIVCTITNTALFVPDPAIDIVKTAVDTDLDTLPWNDTVGGGGDGDGLADAGETIDYEFVVTNIGNVDLSSVAVTDPLITDSPNNGTITCPQTTLDTDPDGEAPFAGGSMTCTATYTLTQADIDAGVVNNTATATGEDSDGTEVSAEDSETVDFTQGGQLADIDLDKFINLPADNNDADSSGDVSAGDTLTYHFLVTNTGTLTLDPVTVSDPLAGLSAITCDLTSNGDAFANDGTDSLDPGEFVQCTATYLVQASVLGTTINNTATATGTPPQMLDDVTATDTETVPVPNPLLSVDKPAPMNDDADGSGDVSVGDTLTYTITATNDGTANLTNVVVSDNKITPTGGTTPCAQVTPGGTCTLIGTYLVTAADVAAEQINNTATAGSDQTPDATDDETVPVPNPLLSVDKPAPVNDDLDDSGDVSVGDTLTYTITATNDGTANLTNVVVSDNKITPTGGTTPCALVAPGGTCTLVGTYVVTAADVAAEQINNTATAGSDQTPDATDDETVPVPNPLLSVDKPAPVNDDLDDSGDVSVGDTLTYTITATNDGTANLTNVVVSDNKITPTGGTTPCALVAPGGTCTLVGTYVVTAADVAAEQINNTATAGSDQTPDATDDETVPVPNPLLSVDKPAPVNDDLDDSGDVSVGDTLTYTITATNDGTANLTNVVVSDNKITPTGGTTPCALVAPGGTCTLVGTYVVTAADVAAEQINNTATAGSDQTPDATDDETVPVPNPLLSVDKPAPVNDDLDDSGDVSVGDTLTYTITATNDGTANLTNVVVSDNKITPTGGTTPCALVAPGGTCTLVGTYVVTAADVAAEQINNTATAGSDQTPDATDDETVPVPNPLLSVDKPAPVNDDLDDSGDVSVGDTLTYTITATNDGTANLTNVVVSDNKITPTGGTTPCALVAPGGTCTLVGTYVVTAADVAAEQINNTATAGSDQTPDATDDETVPVPNPLLSVDKPAPVNDDLDDSGDVSVGDTLTYTITATNDGTANLTNVVVSDNKITPTGGTTPCALVAPGGTCTLVGTYVVTAADVAAEQINNTATAGSDQTPDATDDETVPVPNPLLSVDKPAPVNDDLDDSGDVSVGDTLTYTITATNDGTANLTNVVVSDNKITPTGGTTPCALVAPGGTCTLVGTYVVTAADVAAEQINNTATAGSDQTPDATDDETVPVPNPLLSVDKPAPVNDDLDDSGDVSVGDTLTYTITATNDGTANLTNVVVSDNKITPTGGTTPCALVAPGGTCTLVGTYVVTAADVAAEQINNTATAGSDQTPDATDDETVPVPNPLLSVDKPAPVNDDLDDSGDVSVGDTLTYTITATNDGTANLTNVVVSDNKITPTGGTTPCALVAPGGTCTLVGTYVVTAADVAAEQINNTATAGSDQTPDATDDETVPVPNPLLSVDKPAPVNDDLDDSGDVSVGDTLTYTITATNDGTANLTNVVVSDNKITPTGGTTPCALVAPGGTCTLVGTYVVTAADVAAEQINNTATAGSDQTPDATDDETVPVPNPLLSVDKPAPVNDDLDDSGDVSVGDTLTYTITATNDGTANLTNVVVSDNKITPTGGTTPCALVAPGGTCTLVGTYVVTAADVAAEQINNTATAGSDQTPDATDDETVPVPNPLLSVDKPAPVNDDLDDSGDVSVGDTLTYTITATNDGTANLTNVVVSDNKITPTGGTTPCALVAPGGTCTLVGTYVVTAADVAAEQINNTATAGSDQTPDATDDETVPVPNPLLSVDKPAPVNDDLDDSGDVSVGDTLTYTITATNDGTANLTNVVVSDNKITPTGGTTPCALVAPGGTCTLVGTYVVTAADVAAEQINNTATAGSDQTPDATDDETVPVPNPLLSVDKPAPVNDDLDDSGDVSVGDTLTYTITATNDGTANLTNVVVSDNKITPTGGTTPCALVAPGGTCTLVGTYVVTAADVAAEQINNTATAGSDQTPDATDDETVPVPNPLLSVDKPAPVNDDLDDSGDVSVGDTLTYTITATNDGTANLTNVVVSDNKITPTGGTTPCALVAPGGTCTLVGTYVVTAADVAAEQINNTATAGSDQTPDATDDETVPVPNPLLSVDKPAPVNDDLDDSGDVSVGDTLTYTITATNDGTANLTNVVVSDNKITPTGGTTPCALVAPGGTCTLVGTYVVTAADVAAEQINNTATAGSDQTPDATDDETVPVPNPLLSVDKPAPVNDDLDDSGDVSVGDTLTYTITATNDGTANLTNVVVSDNKITPTGGTTPCALVAPGGTCTLVGTYVVTAADVAAEQINNTATAGSDQTPDATDDETVPVPNPLLSVDKPAPVNDDLDDSGDVSVGDTLTYTITATNDGTANLTNVVVSDNKITPTGGTTPCALVAPGGTCTLVGTYVVTAADVAAEQINNTATAGSDQTPDATDDETVPVPNPLLSVDKPAPVNDDLDDSGDVSVGDTLTYTITATNDGTANLTNVVVSDNKITPTGGTTPCALVAPGGTCTLVGTYVVTAADVAAEQINNTATAGSDQTPDATDDETVPVPNPLLSVDKPAPVNDDLDDSGDVSVGDTLTYTITATNDGTANLTNVVVSDNKITPTGGTTPCALVAPGGTCTLVGTYVVTAADVAAEQINNTATAGSDQTPDATDDETVPVPNPLLSVDKPAPVNDDLDDSGDVSVGDTLTYTITATNDGTANLTNVVVSDNKITPTGGTTPCALVAPGGTCTLVGTYVVTAADVAAEQINNTATAGSDQTPDATDDETVPVPNPLLSVDKPAPVNDDLDDSGDVSVGDTLTYTITATNDGTANLTNVVVSDNKITPTGGTTPCALVAPGGTCTLVGTYVVTAADVAAEQINNTATAGSDQTPDATDDETVPVPNPLLSVDKPAPVNDDLDDSGDVSVGDTLTYTITATNDGTANLTNVVVSDNKITPTGGTTPCALVAPGGTCTLVGTYVVTAADVAAEQINNTATAGSDQTPDATDDETVPVPNPLLSVDKPAPVNDDLDDSGDVSVGDTLTYTITATNDGTANLTNVVVSDNKITPTGGTTPCALVAPGGTCTLVGTYVVTAADVAAEQINNTATAGSDQTPDATDDETVPVPNPLLSVDKPAPVNDDLDDSGDVSVGDTLTYTITATNDGTANLTNVVVSDNKITPTGGTTPCALVAPGGTCTLVGTYVVTAADVAAEQINNTATAGSDQTPDATDDETVPVPNPLLSVDKPAPVNDDLDDSGDVSVGDTLTYTITATNDGTANLTNVVVSDNKITPTGGTTPCALVAPGGTCTLVGTYVVTAADVAAEQINNTATAGSDQTPDATDDETVPVPNPLLSVDKPAPVNDDLDDSGDVSVGDTLTYTITATNDGTANLTNVVVSDNKITPTGGTTPCALVAPGGTCTLVGTYVVTAADVTAGSIDNTATAGSEQTPDDTDTETVPVPNPLLVLTKSGVLDLGANGIANPGDVITYTFTVTNTGTANLTNVTVTDPLPGLSTISCAADDLDHVIDFLPATNPDTSVDCTATYAITQVDIDAGVVNNTATADSTQTDPVDDPEEVPIPQDPSIAIVKTFAADYVIAGGAGSSFTLLVTNTGNVTLTPADVTDSVDSRLTVTRVAVTMPTAAGGETCAAASQSISCTIPTLAVNESAIITVDFFALASAVPEEFDVPNTGTVNGQSPLGVPVTDMDSDEIDILVDITLDIEKLFDPEVIEVPQGTGQIFTIEVGNSGPSDALDVMVTDTLNSFLSVPPPPPDSVVVTAVGSGNGSGTCTVTPVIPAVPPAPPTPQTVDCTLYIPTGESVLITVTYIVAPFLSGPQIFGDGTGNGAEFRFVFDNGSILEGNALGPVYLDGVMITAAGDPGLTKNDYLFDPPGDGPFDQPFLLHLSCSDAYTGGWGQTDGPDEFDNPDWKIDYFSIARYKKTDGENGQFFRSCGNVVDLFEVDNTATAMGTDSFPDSCPVDECSAGPNDPECDVVCDDATVTIKEGILLDKFQKKAKHGSVNLTNFTDVDKVIQFVEVKWPTTNGSVRQITLAGAVLWQGDAPGVLESARQSVMIGDVPSDENGQRPDNYDPTPWIGDLVARTLDANVAERLAFHFSLKANDGSYQIRATFTDGTFLDIVIGSDDAGSGDPPAGSCNNNEVCDAGEDCNSCASDCAGRTGGPPRNRFCCGNGTAETAEGDGSVCDDNF